MRESIFLSLQAEWMRQKARRITRAPAVRRDAKPRVEGLEARALLASITEYPIPAGSTSLGNGLFGITAGPDGNVYFTDTLDNAIGRITATGAITKLPLPPYSGGSFFKNGLDGITLGADGKLAFTESTQGAIGKITTTGSYTSYPIGSSGSLTGQGPDQITKTSDGTLWWTEDGSNAIGELTPGGIFKQYAVPNAYSGGIIGPSMKGITAGSDGNIWFTNWGPLGDFIGRITPSGVVTEYTLPGNTSPVGIVGGPDGNLWFAAYGTNTIDVMSTSGTMLHQYPVTVPAGEGGLASLEYITVGSDKNLYFTAQDGYIGEITTSGAVTSTPVPTVPGSSGPKPLAITSGPDGNIWFTDPWTDSIGVLRIAASGLPTMTALSASTASASLGQSVTFSATVSDLSPGGATPNGGTVTFSDQNGPLDSEPLVDGAATFTTSSLAAGTYSVTASYSGAPDFAPSSTGTPVTVTISNAGAVVQWPIASGGNGHYYELVLPTDSNGGYSWTQADAAASAMTYDGSTGYLATVTSAAENDFLASQFQSSLPTDVPAWIGLEDDGRIGDWTWVTGEPFSYSNWADGEPNNPGTEDWVGYTNGESPTWSWNNFNIDNFGSDGYGFIVEFNPPGLSTTIALGASTTGAAVGQSVAFTATVSDLSAGGATPTGGTVTFTDQNGALDSEPLVGGVATFTTSSLAAGTHTVTASYSGTTDFAASSTVDAPTVTIGATLSVVQWTTASGGNGHYYELVLPADPSENYSWTQANAAASSMTDNGSQGYLATVTSAAENAFLASQFQSSLPPSGSAWIGLADDSRIGDWTWVTGEPFSYSNWAAGEPNNPGVEDWAGYTNGETPAWSWNNFEINNFGAGALYGFIVEFNPPSVLPTSTALSASTTSAALGQSVTFTATVSDLSAGGPTPNAGTVTFSDQNGAMDIETLAGGAATFTTSGLPPGTYNVAASYSGTEDFAPSSTDAMGVTVTISKGTPVVSINPVILTYGTPLANSQLSGTATWTVGGNQVTVPGSWSYTTATGTVPGAGDNQSVSVTFTPTDTADYRSIAATATINVAQARPGVNVDPVNLTYGTPLANSQLTGTANWTVGGNQVTVPGSWSYPLAAGTVLSAGDGQSESVTFTPTDSTDYSAVMTSAVINVSPAPLTITADNQTKPYGSAFTFTGTEFTTSGLLNGDTVTNVTLTSTGAAATADVSGSPYSITVSAAAGTSLTNYSITYVNGALTVSRPTPVISLVRASSSANPSAYGQSIIFDVTIGLGAGSSVTPTGTVTFYNGNPSAGGSKIESAQAVSGGSTSITTNALSVSAAPHLIYAVYTPAPAVSADISSVTSLPLQQTVKADQTAIRLISSANPAKKGKAVIITAVVLNKSVPGSVPMGTVVFKVDGRVKRSSVVPASGKVALSNLKLGVGTHTVTVLYTPANVDFAASHGNLVGDQKVKR